MHKLKIDNNKFDINLKFYFFLKYLLKAKLSELQAITILKIYILNKDIEESIQLILSSINKQTKLAKKQKDTLITILDEVSNTIDLKLFIFSLKLYMIKDLLLQEAKVKNLLDISKLENIDPLSLEYDKITLYSPYSTRVNGALLSLIFFEKIENKETNFISQDAEYLILNLSKLAIELKTNGIEPNQIFMLMFSESINQSIISDSGSDYEDRILSVLTSAGIDRSKITKDHDKDDKSTEFDFFLELNNKTYGIGAKRTLRERYKQFIKTAQMSQIDIMIEITLGIDLTEEKVQAIRNHNVFLFVADEIYITYQYLRDIEGVYSSQDLTIEVLESLK